MPDALNQLRAGALAHVVDDLGAGVAVADPDLHLDQFVVGQRLFQLGQYGLGQAVAAKGHDGLARVGQAAQMAALRVSQIHGRLASF